MNAEAILQQARDAARRRAFAQATLWLSPWLLAVVVLAWRLRATPWWWLVVAVALAIAGWRLWQATRGFDDRWLARGLDDKRTDMEDSAELLFARSPPKNALEDLQRSRLRRRLENMPAPDLRQPWPSRRLFVNAIAASVCIIVIALWPAPQATRTNPATLAPVPAATPARPAQLIGQRIDIRPPAYTGLATRSVETLAAQVPEGSTLQWTLRFAPMPDHAELVFHDGRRLALQRRGDAWTASRRIDKAMLYRVALAHPLPPAQARLHRIDVVTDRPPKVRVVQPQQTLTLLTPGQRSWALAFEASDDYGLAATAQLRITRTEGSGENITAKQQAIALRGTGSTRNRRYAHAIDLAALGLVAGDDLIVQLSVDDRHAPKPHNVRSPSLILRWPPEAGAEASGLDGLLKKVMPAYFRSQRQIIIDAEALLKEKRRLAADQYAERSDGIGVDQRLLRLRYGQFLGEQSEGAPQMPTNDAEDEHATPHDEGEGEAAHDETATATAAPSDDHGHDVQPQRQATFGEEQQVLEKFGHTHDEAEAATLLDAGTRELLRSALDEMWQSETNLRLAHPELALPYAYRALDFIKQVQQASRIYLARVGSELPPIDENRRLGGDRTGLGDRGDPLTDATAADPVVADVWRALAPVSATKGGVPDLDALARWIDTHDTRGADPLALAAAIDALRRDRGCNPCRERLRTLLWPLLPRPPAATGERKPSGRAGHVYLDALGREASR